MLNSIIRIVYFLVISALSTYFYYDRLSRKRGTLIRRKMYITALLIFATHLLLFIPVSGRIESIMYMLQIIFEFYIIELMFDGKTVNKLIVYIEINVAIGVGMVVGYMILGMSYGDSVFTNVDDISRAIYYAVTVAVTGVICFILSIIGNIKDKTDNFRGMEASVVICMALLCMMYAVGMTMVDMKEKWILWMVYGYFVVMILLVIVLLIMNKRVQSNENMNIRYQVLTTINENMKTLEKELKQEEEAYSRKRLWLEKNLQEIYDEMRISVTGSISASISSSMAHEANIGEPLKEFIDKKRNDAKIRGINLLANIEMIDEFKLHTYDLVSIVANLLDNAIRAVEQDSVIERNILLECYVDGDKFYLGVENPFSGQTLENDGIFLTTKSGDGHHGLGVSNVKAIAEKYNMSVDISTDDGIFKVVVQR